METSRPQTSGADQAEHLHWVARCGGWFVAAPVFTSAALLGIATFAIFFGTHRADGPAAPNHDRSELPPGDVKSSSAPSPLLLSTQNLDLGEGSPNEELTGEIVLENRSDLPQEFTVSKSCGCTSVTPHSGTIRGGERVPIQIKLRLKELPESTSRATVSFHCKGEQFSCSVAAQCRGWLELSANSIDFGKLSPGALPEQPVQVQLRPRDPHTDLRTLRISQSTKAFEIALRRDGSVTVLEARLVPDLIPGEYFDIIQLAADGIPYLMSIPIRATVGSPLTVVPSTLLLAFDRDRKNYRPAELIVIGRDAREPLGEVSIAGESHGFQIENLGQIGETRRRIRLLPTGDSSFVASGETLQLHVEGVGATCDLKIFLDYAAEAF